MKRMLVCLLLPLALFATNLRPVGYVNAAVTSTPVQVNVVGTAPASFLQYNLSNPNSSQVWVQFFDAASPSAVSVGTTAPTLSMAIPPFGVTDGSVASPYVFQYGIIIAATTTQTGSAAPSSAVQVQITYQ